MKTVHLNNKEVDVLCYWLDEFVEALKRDGPPEEFHIPGDGDLVLDCDLIPIFESLLSKINPVHV